MALVRGGRVRPDIREGTSLNIFVDGRLVRSRVGETVLTALRSDPGHVREFEFMDEVRAGFCLMGACQDCWLWREGGERLRACTSEVEADMRLLTRLQEAL
ncbi:putative molibdopterin-dependent oxidoreductase YjgC [Rhizobium sp. BK650]|uniref:(2Fe-2S)-binding protein n=1 Tax=Rhizobium sp. BK650 TaxID=2586990 RepID=UPI00162227EE|nr:(2Fe-2S)-binding protein [Rhizobium sp. BK650]MBB3659728.1 putative molibdopterin-dependent oxidoreductase YjgC [Rhizobium sp. BK650]